MSSDLGRMISEQYAQQRLIWGDLPEGRDDQRLMAERLATRLVGAVHDYLSAIDYNSFFSEKEAPRSTRVLELTDILKYALALAWTEQCTPRELVEAFAAKTQTVTERYTRSVLSSRVCGFDIDGVLCQYDSWGPDEATFIESGGVLTLKPMPGAQLLLEQLKSSGWSIVIVTARKAHIYKRLERDTHDWLVANQFPYDRLLFGYDKMEMVRSSGAEIKFFVEDAPKHALDLANGGIPVFHISQGNPITHHNIVSIRDLVDIIPHLRRRLML